MALRKKIGLITRSLACCRRDPFGVVRLSHVRIQLSGAALLGREGAIGWGPPKMTFLSSGPAWLAPRRALGQGWKWLLGAKGDVAELDAGCSEGASTRSDGIPSSHGTGGLSARHCDGCGPRIFGNGVSKGRNPVWVMRGGRFDFRPK